MSEIQETIENLMPIPEIKPNEIRIIVQGGIIQGMEVGSDVPENIVVNSVDLDVDSMSPKEMSHECYLTADNDPCVLESVDVS